ncbi:uncharacterized protein LOC124145753 [Haliotis rufescens]|uniref:uncharacterized protein LOC124145753 n=1 Tax=Haliotis rufescens TaxID=6454 RepID=UPI001EB03C0E|nr:uncharacterized protein LOC124145753 [Haliotis rufescens]
MLLSISYFILWLVGDTKTAERLHDFSIDLYDEDPSLYPLSASKLCYFYSGSVTTPGATATVACSRPVTGRFVRISGRNKLNYDDMLTMCDIQVFGVRMNTHFNSCASLVQYKRKQFNTTPTKTITVDSPASCASECERWETCTGFNIRHLPDATCELLQGATIDSLQSNPTWDSYLYHPCFNVCE